MDKGCGNNYTVGENITIYFKSNKDSYLTLFEQRAGGRIRLLFPNRYRKNNFFEANKVHAIPSASDKFYFEVTPPLGKEVIRAIATTSPWQFSSDKEILRYYNEHQEERNDSLGTLAFAYTNITNEESAIKFYWIVESNELPSLNSCSILQFGSARSSALIPCFVTCVHSLMLT